MAKAGSELNLDDGNKPLWLLAEVTYRCPLRCPWCSNPLDFAKTTNELTTEQWKKTLVQARELGTIQLGFSGGEPMVRKDIEELVAFSDDLGFYTNLITSGMGLTKDRLVDMKKGGLKHIQLSFQHSNRKKNDFMVGARSYDQKMEVAQEIKSQGIPVVLNVPVSRYNIEDVDKMLDLAEEIGVDFVEFANIQYYNWALLNRGDLMPTIEQLKHAEARVNERRARLGNKMTIYFIIPDYFNGRPKPCMNGWGSIHMTIAPDGSALPCNEATVIEGLEFPNVRDYDLDWIWNESPTFMKFRGLDWMKEPCRSCSEKETDFGGCRCQAFMLTGDAANADPACSKSPHFNIVEAAVEAARNPAPGVSMPLVMRDKRAVNYDLEPEET